MSAAARLLLTGVALAAALAGSPPAAGQGIPIDVDVHVVPMPSPAGILTIRRVEITFPNGRGEITVPLGAPLAARALVDCVGNGPLLGRWVVDGRALQEVNQTVTFGASLALETAAIPGLPTFEPGLHEVTLQLTTPAVAFALPVARYVVESAAGPGRGAIALLEPEDGATVAASARKAVEPGVAPTASGKGTSSGDAGVAFSWSQSGLGASRFAVEVYAAGARERIGAAPLASAMAQSQSYLLPAALLSTLPLGKRLEWRVRALNSQGQELAVSGWSSFTLVPAAQIQLLTPAEGATVPFPSRFSWETTRAFASHELRVYRNEAALRADLGTLQGPATIAEGMALAQGTTAAAPPEAPLFTAAATAKHLDVGPGAVAAAGPGAVLRWVVVGRDATGQLAAVSEMGGFVVEPQLRTVGGLPAILEMAGQEIAVQAYAAGARLGALSGNGAARFAKDRSRRDIPLSFQGLAATPYIEQRRVVAFGGVRTTVTIVKTLRATVTAGRIEERFAQPLALDLAGYAARLSALTLQEGTGPSPAAAATASATRAAGPPSAALSGEPLSAPAAASRLAAPTLPGAWADLRLDLPGYVQAPGGGAVTVPMPGTRLARGGDFYRELSAAEGPPLALASSAAGPLRYQRTGTLVADFASERDWVGPGGAYAADGLVLLADGLAELPASALFPVLEPALLRLVSGIASLAPGSFWADFTVQESDVIQPVVPAGYAVVFTGGKLAVSGGAVVGRTLRLDGRVTLPEKVHRVPAGTALVPFQGLAPAGAWLAGDVEPGDLQWGVEAGILEELLDGGSGATAVMAKAQQAPTGASGGGAAEPATVPPATMPPKARTTPPVGGGAAPPAATTTTASGGGAAIAGSGGAVIVDPGLPTVAGGGRGATPGTPGAEGKPFVLRGAKGSLRLPFANPNPDPALAGVHLSSGCLDSPFALDPSSRGDNPADAVDLRIRAAGVRGTVASAPPPAPSSQTAESGSALDLFVRRRTMALGDFGADLVRFSLELQDGAVVRSSVDGRLAIPRPADLKLDFTGATVSATGELVGPSLATPATLPLPAWRVVVTPRSLALSRSFLRLQGGRLGFPVDAALGPEELAPLLLDTLDLGADGQVRAVSIGTSTALLGVPFTLDSASAVTFAPGSTLAPGPSQALVTLSGLLSFPVLDRAMRVTVDHTASGAAVHFADASYELGHDGPDSIHVRGRMAFVNGYAQGKAWKEFLGLAELKVLDTADLVALGQFGTDGGGLYQKFGIGLGADAERAASLYQSGGLSIGVKLGQAGVALLPGGGGHAAEVTALVGDAALLAAGGFKSQREMDQAMFKAIGDAVRLARLIHLDNQGQVGDGVETALSLAAAGLSVASDLSGKTHKNLSPQQTVVLVLTALDVAFPVLEQADFVKRSPETLAVLAFVRLGARATRLYLDDGRLSDKDWFALGKQLFQSVRPLSSDPSYRLAMDLMTGVFTAAEGAQPGDNALLARVASSILGSVRTSGLLHGPDWKNILVISQALLDGAVAAKDLPWPDSALALGTAVLDAAAGTETDYGTDEENRKVKLVLKLSRRTLEAVSVTGAGIPYDRAAVTVKDAYDTAAVAETYTDLPRLGVQDSVQRLISLWERLKSRPLADSLTELQQLLCEVGGDKSCASPVAFDAQLAATLQSITGASTAVGYAAAMKRLDGLASWGKENAPASDRGLYRSRMLAAIAPSATTIDSKAAGLVTSELVPRIAGSTSPEAAAAAVTIAKEIQLAAEDVRAFLAVAGTTSGPTLVSEAALAPIETALASLRAGFARQIQSRLAATVEPSEVLALKKSWQKVEPPRADDPLHGSMRQAFGDRRAPLIAECRRRIEGQLFAAAALLQDCSLTLGEIFGPTGDELTMAVLAPLFASLLTLAEGPFGDAAASYATYMSSLTAFSETAPKNPMDAFVDVWPALEDLATARYGGTATVDARLDQLLDALLVQVRAGSIGAGAVFQYRFHRALLDRGMHRSTTAAARLAQIGPLLIPAASASAPGLLAQLDIASTSPSEAVATAATYWLVAGLLGNALQAMEAKVDGWIAVASAAPCAKRLEKATWLLGMRPFVPTKAQALWDGANDIDLGCTRISYAPDEELAKIATAGNEIKAELERLAASAMPEADKKEAIGWFIAARLETLTDGFAGEVAEEKILRAVHTQVRLVNQFRLKPRAERIAAAGDVLVAAMGDLFPKSAGAQPVVKAVFKGLQKFVQAGGEQLPPGQRALELVAAVALEATPSGTAKQLVGGWLGLLKSHTGATVALTAIPTAVAAGVGLALQDKVKLAGGQLDLPATLAALKIEPDDFWISIGRALPALMEIADSAPKLLRLTEGLLKVSGTPEDKLAALDKFVTEAPKLSQIGPYVAAVLKPKAHLLAPDTDQEAYVPNALLAFLGTARQKLPAGSTTANKATCPTVSLTTGVTGVASTPQEHLLCAVDLARELVRQAMSGFFGGTTTPYQLLGVSAREDLERLRADSVFARAGADEDLSGLSGRLELRPGAIAPTWTLDVLATLVAKPVVDVSARLTLTSGPRLRLEQAVANDGRKVDDLLQRGYDYAPGTSRLFGIKTGLLSNPVRRLLIDFDPAGGCASGALGLDLTLPLGQVPPTESAVELCWQPAAWFRFRSTGSTSVPGVPASLTSTVDLCAGRRGSFSGAGIDLLVGGSIEIPVPLTPWGLYAQLDAGLGLGPPGVSIRGRFDSGVGLYRTGLQEAQCLGVPLVDLLGVRIDGSSWEGTGRGNSPTGTCRSGLGFQFDVVAGLGTPELAYLKAQARIPFVGGWLYASPAAGLVGGAGDLPSLYGGFTGPALGRAATFCAGAPPAGSAP